MTDIALPSGGLWLPRRKLVEAPSQLSFLRRVGGYQSGTRRAFRAGWWFPSAAMRMKLTVQSAQVPSTQTNFKFFVNNAGFPAAFYDAIASDGGNLRVTTPDGTRVPVDAVYKDEMYFKAPSLAVGSVFHIYLDPAWTKEAANATYGANAVYSNSYVSVWHLTEDPSGGAGTIIDSVGNNHGQGISMEAGDLVTGKLGKCHDFDGAAEYISIPDAANLSFGSATAGSDTALTFSAWCFMDDATTFRIFTKGALSTTMEYLFTVDGSDKLLMRFYDENTSNVLGKVSSSAYTGDQGNWHFYAVTYSGNEAESGIQLYRDGATISGASSSAGSYVAMHNLGGVANIARYEPTPSYANGKIDEMCVASAVRSTDWLATEFNNQNAPESFYAAVLEGRL